MSHDLGAVTILRLLGLGHEILTQIFDKAI
jgi:hypothetical protein